jgi:hypothetical protein
MKKIIPLIALYSLAAFAQNQTQEPKQKDIQAQEESKTNPAVKKQAQKDVYKIGPFDREGQYQYYDRQEREAREAQEEESDKEQ